MDLAFVNPCRLPKEVETPRLEASRILKRTLYTRINFRTVISCSGIWSAISTVFRKLYMLFTSTIDKKLSLCPIDLGAYRWIDL